MSGWIKFEKDLLTDPRTIRLAQKLASRWEVSRTVSAANPVTSSRNASPLPGVTLVLGGLVMLWALADTHIGEDDILPLGIEEIDQIIGLKGFCEILPADWLQVIDANSVKLPNYHAHNGTIAKERALNQKRVARSRDNAKRTTVSKRNGRALPDQDLDQTKTYTKTEESQEARDGEWEGHRAFVLDELRSVYPSNLHTDADWEAVARVLAGRLTAGETTQESLHRLTLEFAAQQDAKGNRNTQFIENPSKHYDGRGKWKGPFLVPAAQQKREETAMDRIRRLNSPDNSRVIEHG